METFYTHLWKSAVIITLFYGFYKLILQQETFFKSIRYFLIFGIIAAIILPFIIIPTYITIEPTQTLLVNGATHTASAYDSTVSWFSLFSYIYISITTFLLLKFLIQLMSIALLISKSNHRQSDSFFIIETNSQTSPFSFFNFIVYNPSDFTDQELQQIIAHEKAHAIQKHSVDSILSNLLVAFLWFNPFVWFYRNKMEQNLEFIADEYAQRTSESSHAYQQLLLKTTLPNYQMALANNFYNSLLKKRIIMLHSQRSNSKSQWKFVIILPFLIAFLFAFNTKTIAQQKKSKKKMVTITAEVFAMVINKETTKSGLNDIVTNFSKKGLDVKLSGVKRNKASEITAIKISAKTKDGKKTTSYAINDDKSIDPIQLSFDEENKSISIGTLESLHGHGYTFTTKGKEHSVMVMSDDDGQNTWVSKKGKKKYIVEIEEDHDEHQDGEHEDGQHDIEETVILNSDGKEVKKEIIKVSKGRDNKFVLISGDEDKHPLILLDGKEITKQEMDAIDTDTIESINVYKGDKATKKYGDKGKNGVVLITSKKE